MEEDTWHFQHIMKGKGKNTTEMQKETCAVCGEGAVTEWMCQQWFSNFYAGDFSLDSAPWLGKWVESW